MDLVNYLSPILNSIIFVFLISIIKEPYRKQLMVIMLAFAGGVYLNNAFQLYPALFGIITCTFTFLGNKSYRFIGIGWILHGLYDWIHHTNGFPMINGMAGTAFDCAIFDMGIAIYFLLDAPNLFTIASSYFKKTRKI